MTGTPTHRTLEAGLPRPPCRPLIPLLSSACARLVSQPLRSAYLPWRSHVAALLGFVEFVLPYINRIFHWVQIKLTHVRQPSAEMMEGGLSDDTTVAPSVSGSGAQSCKLT